MMSLVDICQNFPRVSFNNVDVRERNLVFAEMEDGSGYCWNLKVMVNGAECTMFVRFERVTRKPSDVVIEGKQCVEGTWEWIASK